MNRNLLMLFVAAVMSVAGTGILLAEAKSAKSDACCNECKACETACLECADACLDELADGNRKDCIKSCQDCADICGVCSKIAARNGPMKAIIAAACTAACENCADECAKHKDDDTCQACAEQRRTCAKECLKQAKKK
jgi:hypothetical protein